VNAPALLSYAVTPTMVPSSGSVTLLLVASNATGEAVDCGLVEFALPVGVRAGSLTDNPGAIEASPVAGTPWAITGDGAGNFTATGPAVAAGESIAFVLSGLAVAPLVGLAKILVWEGGSPPRQTQVAVSKVPPGLAITKLTAAPIEVAPGERVTLSWSAVGAQQCTLSWAGQSRPVAIDGDQIVSPSATTTYTLTASGGTRVAAQQVTVAVPSVRLRAVEPGDAESLHAIFASSRERELAALPPDRRDGFLRLQFDAQDRQYREAHPNGSFDLVLAGDTVIGRLYVERGADAVHVIDVTLLPEHRGAGIGSALLGQLIADADASALPVRLHVERANRAAGLYERLGFRELEDRGAYLLLERPAQLKTAS
jgi:ribosomal protein S18 acetylase RimI-like enzyme